MSLVNKFTSLSLQRKLLILFVLALTLRLLSYYTHPYISSDSIKYLSIAYYDSIGEIQTGLDLHRQLPPAILYFMRVINFLGVDVEAGYRFISIFLYSFTMFGLFYISRCFLSEKAALFVAFCYACHPKFIGYSHGVFRESLAIPFMIAGLCILFISIEKRKPILVFLAGSCISISYMARLEYGLAIVGASIIFLIFSKFIRFEDTENKKRILLSVLGVVFCMLPLLLIVYFDMKQYNSEWDPFAYKKITWFFMRAFK